MEKVILSCRMQFYMLYAKNRPVRFRFASCDCRRWSVSSDVKCRRYIQAFILHNILICASNQKPPGLAIEIVIFSWMCNFCLIQAKKTDVWRRDLCFVIFLRRDVKCRRNIQAFILHNIFICASNQNPPGFTIEKVISSWMCNFYLIQAKTDDWRWDMCFVIFRGAMSSVAGTFKLLSILHNILICAWNQNPPGLTIEKVISSWMCNFYLIQAKNRRLKVKFVFCDFPRCDVKCRRYIQALIIHNIFICASNQNPLRLTIENVIFCWMCNFYWIQAKHRRLKVRFVFCDFPRCDVKCRRYI